MVFRVYPAVLQPTLWIQKNRSDDGALIEIGMDQIPPDDSHMVHEEWQLDILILPYRHMFSSPTPSPFTSDATSPHINIVHSAGCVAVRFKLRCAGSEKWFQS